jgi:hypothetical protein
MRFMENITPYLILETLEIIEGDLPNRATTMRL